MDAVPDDLAAESKFQHWTRVGFVARGLLYIVIQPIHPEENAATVTSNAWVVVAGMTIAMAVLGLLGARGMGHGVPSRLGLAR